MLRYFSYAALLVSFFVIDFYNSKYLLVDLQDPNTKIQGVKNVAISNPRMSK